MSPAVARLRSLRSAPVLLRPFLAVVISLAVVAAATSCGSSRGEARDQPRVERFRGVISRLRFGDAGPDDLRSFVVGTTLLRIDTTRDYGFALGHLRVHEEQRLPVIVDAEKRTDGWYALRILDG